MFFIRDPRGSLFRRPARSLSRDGTGTCHVRPRDTSCRPRVSHRLESSVRCRRLTVLSRRGTPRFRARPRASFVFASTDTHLSPRLTEFILARRPTPRSRLSLPGRRQRRRARRLPPYESVVLDEPPPADDAKVPDDPKRESHPRGEFSPQTESAPPAFLGADGDVTVEVGKATKVGEGMSAYASYPVTSSTTSPAFRAETSSVSRRFSDFTRLRKALRTAHPGVIVYPLPEKTVTTSPFHPEFLEQRRVGLDTFARPSRRTPRCAAQSTCARSWRIPAAANPPRRTPAAARARATRAGRRRRRALPFRRRRAVRGTPRRRPRRRLGTSAARRERR